MSTETWIPVGKALPDEVCLFYTDDLRNPTDVWVGIYRDGGWNSCGYEVYNVTHWQPLPEPPRRMNREH